MYLTVPVDNRVKTKESKWIEDYLDLAGELKKLGNMRVKVIPIVDGVLVMVPKGLLKRLEELEIRGRI